jgi:hypothetical protein
MTCLHDEYYPVLNRYVIRPWKDTEEIIWILMMEITQYEKTVYCVIPTIRHSENSNTMETVK